MQCLSATHVFDYILVRINPSLTSCKDLATVVDNNLSACNTNYFLPYRCSYVWDNESMYLPYQTNWYGKNYQAHSSNYLPHHPPDGFFLKEDQLFPFYLAMAMFIVRSYLCYEDHYGIHHFNTFLLTAFSGL